MKNIDVKGLISDYQNCYGLSSLCAKYHIGKERAKSILRDNGIDIKKPSSFSKKREFVIADWREEKYPIISGMHYRAISKDGKFTTFDYMNKAGILTSYIKDLGIEIPSLYDRRIYYQTTGNYWWEQWFDIISEVDCAVKKCPYCDWETVDVENKSGAFEQHLKNVHNITKEEYLRAHPEEKEYFTLKNTTLDLQMEGDSDKFVVCKICGKKLKRIDWRHLSLHGISFADYVERYGDNTVSKDLHEHLSNNSKIANEKMVFHKESAPEKEIKEYLSNLNIMCVKNRKILKGQEIDIYIPEKNLGIEFNGNFYHTEIGGGKGKYYHLNKTRECEKNGVALIQIFEDEWEISKDIVLSKIRHTLHLDKDLEKIYARKCEIKLIKRLAAKDFLSRFHIQGYTKASVHCGAYYNGCLVGVMSFVQRERDKWELVRFATDYNYICCGVGGKLFKYFVDNYKPLEIKSFADRRWTTNYTDNIYVKLGFDFCGFTLPEYRYFNQHINRVKRFHKFSFRKNIMLKKYGEKFNLTKDMTEIEMAHKIGCDRIWDCGLIKYIWKAD